MGQRVGHKYRKSPVGLTLLAQYSQRVVFFSTCDLRYPLATMFRKAAFLFALLPFCSAQVSEGFESGWDQSAWPTYAPDCSQGGKVTLDTSTAHSGKNSIRVDGAGGYCGHIFFGTTKVPSGDIYVRAFM